MSSRGNWIQTFSGGQFFPLDPRPEDVRIEDIAHALSVTCRFSGHCTQFYSVAQHSVAVAFLTGDLWGLLHDAAEAYLVDLPSPIKKSPGFEAFKVAEEKILQCVAERFDLGWPMPEAVRVADRQMLAVEARDLMAMTSYIWSSLEGIDVSMFPPVAPVSWKNARNLFLHKFRYLGGS